jgi:hypothetical protein
MDVRIPPRSAVTIFRLFQPSQFKKPVFGVAVHLRGKSMCSNLPVFASAYCEVRLPLEWGGYVHGPLTAGALGTLASVQTGIEFKARVSHEALREFTNRPEAFAKPPVEAVYPQIPAGRTMTKPPSVEGAGSYAEARMSLLTAPAKIANSLNTLLSPTLLPLDSEHIEMGSECDPDNVPDDLPEGTVWQLTGETAWRFVPGRIHNAKKGDVILSPGSQTIIAQLLRQVHPAQYYSHSGVPVIEPKVVCAAAGSASRERTRTTDDEQDKGIFTLSPKTDSGSAWLPRLYIRTALPHFCRGRSREVRS